MSNMNKNIRSGSRKLRSGSNTIYGLSIILFGQVVNLLAFFYRPASDSKIESLFQYIENLMMISIFVTLTCIIGIMMIINDLKGLLVELQSDREKIDHVVQYLASEIKKK